MRSSTKHQHLTLATLVTLALGACGGEPVKDLLGSQAEGLSVTLLTSAVNVAAPYAGTAGGALDVPSCYARSIWDMQRFGDRIYLGAGDRHYNSGATTVWSMSAADGAVTLQSELVVDEEMVQVFRLGAGKLYIPGVDSTEAWDLGNIYVNDGQAWTKRRSVPNGVHVNDVAELDGRLFAFSTDDRLRGHLHTSDDSGQSWRVLTKSIAGMLVPMAGRVLIFGESRNGTLQVYENGRLSRGRAKLYPHTSATYVRPSRTVRYKDHVLYVAEPLPVIEPAAPLLALADPNRDPQVRFFGGATPESVRDIIVEADAVYVLTARRDGNQFAGSIYRSTDLADWTQVAAFTVPAVPLSFELLGGSFYVGLGTAGLVYEDTTAETAAGSIWRIE